MDYGLSQPQLTVINALSGGASTLSAAAEAGVHRNTISNWRRNCLAFQHALAHAQYDRALAAREKAEELLDISTQTIRAILEDPAAPASVRLRAALAILQTACTPPEPKKQVWLQFEKVKVLSNPEPLHNSAQPEAAPPPTQPATTGNLHNAAQPPHIRTTPDIGRNELCPCGSKVKYKKCCLNKPAPNPLTARIAA